MVRIMNYRLIPHILLYIWTLTFTEAFYANIFGDYVGKSDYTQAEITEIGILKAVATYFEETPAGGSQATPGSLTGIIDITAKKLYDQVYGGSRSAKRLQEAIDEIIYYNSKVDEDHYYEAAWHFNGEQIPEGHKKLQGLRSQVLSELRKQNPDFKIARKLIGQFLHIVQMFYSNTNWCDYNGNSMYPAIGQNVSKLLPTAPPNVDTCSNCTAPCVMNFDSAVGTFPTLKFLTSGYKGGQDIQKPFKDPSKNTNGKCSHGGPLDNTTTTVAAIGGINKDSKVFTNSPHYYSHSKAAEAAVGHTLYFFNDNTNGIRHLIIPDNFPKLFNLDPAYSLVFVIDESGSIASDFATIVTETRGIIQKASASKNPPAEYILVTFSDPVATITVQKTDQAATINGWISAISPSGGDDCPEFSLTAIEQAANVSSKDSIMYVFTDSTPKDPYKEDKINSLIADKRLQIFFIVTGTCSTSDHSGMKYSNNIPHAGRKRRSVIENRKLDNNEISDESLEELKNVLIVKAALGPDDPPVFVIPVDNSLSEMTVQIQGNAMMPYVVLQKPDGNYLNVKKDESGYNFFTDRFVYFTIKNPQPGKWRIFRFDKSHWAVEVSGRSNIHFEFSVAKESTQVINDNHMKDVYEVNVFVEVNNNSSIILDLLVVTAGLNLLQKVTLERISEHEYACKLYDVQKSFIYGVEGLDSDGNTFQRYPISIMSLNEENTVRKEKRNRRSLSFDLIDIYRNLATVSGGHVFQTTQKQVPNAATIFKRSLESAEVLVLKNVFPGGPSTTREIHIEIDSSISQFTLKIQSKNDVPRFNLNNNKGNSQPVDNKTATIYQVGDNFISVVVESPGAGTWVLRKNDINEWDVEVTGKSTVDFVAKLMQYDPDSHSLYEFRGRPIPDENVTVSVELNEKNAVKDLSEISFLDIYGHEIAHYSLKPKETRYARAFFSTTVIIPQQSFKLAVVGTTPANKPFVRLHRDVIETVNVKLEHKPGKDPLYINEELNVTFIVTNAGSQDEDVKVTIKDDKNFVTGKQARTFHLKAWTNQTGYFTLRGGSKKGEVTTITLTAKPAVATRSNSKFMYTITHLTVDERPDDKTPPVCNVTSSSIPCTDPCKCSQINAFITAEIWDEGNGLKEIKGPNTTVNSLHSVGFSRGLVKQKGIVKAILVVDCCRKNVSITVKDLKNLTGSCDIPIDPTYDANACTTTTTTTTTMSTTLTTTSNTSSTTQSSISSASSNASFQSTVSSSSSVSSSGSSTIKSSKTSVNPVSVSQKANAATNITSGNVTTTASVAQSQVENSSEISDGASYGIAAAVGGVTMAATVGAVIFVIKKVLAGSPKTKPENTNES